MQCGAVQYLEVIADIELQLGELFVFSVAPRTHISVARHAVQFDTRHVIFTVTCCAVKGRKDRKSL